MKDFKMDRFKDKSVLITGGTGSFGSTLITDLIKTDIGQIKVLSRDEKKQEELRFRFNDDRIKFFVGDVRDPDTIERAVRNTDYVFHAAALKQVPSCEFNPFEAVKTNVIGANNVIEKCISNRVKSLVVLSTDKAVYPINTMGISKALMEKLAINSARECYHAGGMTKINVTRYGNVMGSRGSVIPLFIDKIKNGQDITLTVPSMTRFMMTLEESVELVYHAFLNCEQGETVVKKAPAATVEQLARVMIKMFNANVGVKIIGARHGEKLHESLCSAEEMSVAKDHGDFFSIPADIRQLTTYESSSKAENFANTDSYTSSNTDMLSDTQLENILLKLKLVRDALN
ncbi:polysaccharide biosynthesis protein [Vibrio vulnificus]|uniref:polysaccharide biosynthesis protein n=1 Tax=Vibrio vulnificus TaxID=672 RepID=UPI0009B713C1|nr:polysaccharide biosynthesis protein [Vibrio vulnificus]EGQ8093353.1 polysaccharide biosynthesis protein [Vibrio vulnificus]OQK47715.1 UDP-glucose 4-epimerase [Vibrio vulnificus]POC26008.1 UDP-glucose 4-epimerase [Vibrio vulnificus]